MAIGDGVSPLASLTVTFGGFSPTVMDGVATSKAQVERMQKTMAKRREANLRRHEIEMARASSKRRFTDEEGSLWTYVVMDGSFIRIDRCAAKTSSVRIPEFIEEMPVRALGSDIFQENDLIQEIICPDTVEFIASCAFRLSTNLRRVVFSAKVSNYLASWLQQCDLVEEIVLPGLLDELVPAILEKPALKRLYIGKELMGVKQGACEKTRLEKLVLDADNPFIWTDGDAIYSHDRKQLIALARPVTSYEVLGGCESLAKKACMGIGALQQVTLPDSLTIIGEFAFAHTGLKSIDIPASVTEVSAKAFFHCLDLRQVTLHEGLVTLGDSAFAESGLESIFIPASIESIGASATENTNIVHSGARSTYQISPDSTSLFFDGEGGLYRREDDGIHFIQLIDRDATTYRVFEGTRFIDEYAFALHPNIEQVVLPEGVREVRKKAFRVCPRLRRVYLPNTLVSIGEEAFVDTVLESIDLPAALEHLSDDALVTAGAHRIGEPPSLRSITVHEDNPLFYVESGLLCRRGENGDRGIVFNDDVEDVVIPSHVTTIADFAFSNARNIRTFSVGPNLQFIGSSGLSTWCFIENIHIEVREPIEGRSEFDVRFPDMSRSVHEISISLGGSSWVNVPEIFRHYDNCLAHAHNYHNPSSDEPSAYEQVKCMMERLKDPIMLVSVNKGMFERIIREHIVDICIDVARHDDRAVVDDLCDFGFVNNDNLEEIIVAVGRLQDAAMSGYLLELKRRRFGLAAFDFDL